ncbi:hypothetical protein [Actinomadura harenae]|uniref:Uncharacterized protein n=1 Tax=Actinomadura harenae TaxID=2483351 RepID=A0A3M2M7B6_9ACTN|nr:hypothetical protein [Actinomadura harenae]RMI45486.1 hypothetical protein EBO15_09765 [Actinomadura harenae]
MADSGDLLWQAHSGSMTPAEGLAALDELYGPQFSSADQDRADAWARRATGQAKDPGDDRRLEEADRQIASRYGRSVGLAS